MLSAIRSVCRGVAAKSGRGRRASVVVEYLLLITLVGIGVIVGIVAVRNALVVELEDLANAIHAIGGNPPPGPPVQFPDP